MSFGLSFFLLLFLALPALAQQPNVNERTLNLFLPFTHLKMPCLVSIEIQSNYNSYSGKSSIFGRKWSFNHNIFIEKDVTHFTLHEGDGFENRYTREENLEAANKALAQRIVIEMKKEDSKNQTLKEAKEYDRIEKRLAEDESFREEQAKRFVKVARPLMPGEYHSLSRGKSRLIFKKDGSFERQFQNGSKELFNKEGQIIKSMDRNGNSLDYVYNNDQLTRITDACGRSVNLDYYATASLKGLVRTISDGLGNNLTFTYDENRRLVAHTNANGSTTTYRYAELPYITRIENSADKSKTLNFRYNDKLELVEQIGPGDSRVTYERSFVAENPNHSITEIKFFKGNALQSRETHEFHLGKHEIVTQFDSQGKQTSKKTTQLSSISGFPESITDELGRGDLFEYDSATGNITSREDIVTKRKMEFTHHPRCEQITKVQVTQPGSLSIEIDYEFDKNCNVVKALEKTGEKLTGHIEVKHDERGRASFVLDRVSNRQIAFTHWDYGKPDSITLRDVGTLRVTYKNTGEIEKVDTFPHGEKGKARFKDDPPQKFQQVILAEVRAALDQMQRLLKPAGLTIGL